MIQKGKPGLRQESAESSGDDEAGRKRGGDESSQSDSECDEEYLDQVAEPLNPMKAKEMAQRQQARTSVSAEVFGKYHIKEAFKPKVIAKSQEVQGKIKERLSNAFMFMSLDERDLKVVIDAMDDKKV